MDGIVANIKDKDATYYPWIDVLRGISWIFVVLAHTTPGYQTMGRAGVGIFFAISGWLITGILLRQKEHNFTTLITFFTRRSLRILPLYYLLIFVVCMSSMYFTTVKMWLAPAFIIHPEHRLLKHLLTFSAEDCRTSLIGVFVMHCWSLCVEERFYLVLPLVIAFAPRGHYSRCSLALILATAWYLVVSTFPTDLAHYVSCRQTFALHLLPFPMLFGSVLAVLLAKKRPELPALFALPACAACVIGYLRYTYLTEPAYGIQYGNYSAVPGLWATGIIYFAVSARSMPVGLLSLALQKLGKLSYAAYIIHEFFALMGCQAVGITGLTWDAPLFAIALCVPCAYLVNRWIEAPILGWRGVFEKSPPLRTLCSGLQVVPIVIGLIFFCPPTMQRLFVAGLITTGCIFGCWYAFLLPALRSKILAPFMVVSGPQVDVSVQAPPVGQQEDKGQVRIAA